MPDRTPIAYVIDDDQAIRREFEEITKTVNIHTETFASVREFLALATPSLAGCIVLDVRLPEIDGLTAQRHFREIGIALPIIFISGYADIWTVVEAMKGGAMDFLAKPFRTQALIGSIQKAFQDDLDHRKEQVKLRQSREILAQLTEREQEILVRMSVGMASKEIANELDLSVRTVEHHRLNIRQKVGSRFRVVFAAAILDYCVTHGINPPSFVKDPD